MVKVDLNWSLTYGEYDPLLEKNDCLYAFFQDHCIFYIGQAIRRSVGEAISVPDKRVLMNRILDESHAGVVNIIVGEPRPSPDGPILPRLIDDVASVLTYKLQPFGNSDARDAIPVDYMLSVECAGAWPCLWKTFFHDGGPATSVASTGKAADVANDVEWLIRQSGPLSLGGRLSAFRGRLAAKK